MPDLRTLKPPRGSIMRVIAPLLLLAVGHAASAAEVPAPVVLPGGFVDATGQIGVFNTPSGGIQAVELATGKTFFQTHQAQRPLFLHGDRLYALAAVKAPVVRGLCFEWQPPWDGPRNGFRLVAFDLAQFGETVLESETVALPEWASIVEAHDRSCTLRWHLENGRLVVAWDTKTWYAGPTQKTPAEQAAFRKQASGAVRFDLETTAFETLPPQPAPSTTTTFETWREMERLAIRWQKHTAKQLLVVTHEEAKELQTLSLRAFDLETHQQVSVKTLKTGERLTVLPTLDEQYLCVREGSPGLDVNRIEKDHAVQWSIFTVEGGQQVGEVPYEPGMTTATVLGGRAYFLIAGRINGTLDRPFVVPRSLRAVDLKTGTTLWERPVGGKPSAPPPTIAWPAPVTKPAHP
jgi:hypothetical protein